jgi:enamine deaminase RidA (YjgF/YER057c/UK114 family)
MKLSERLASLNIVLPTAPAPAGAYVPAKRVGDLVFVSGQVPMKDGKLMAVGQVSSRCSVEQAKLAARQCVLQALAAASALPGGIDQLAGVARVGAFVSCDTGFTQQPQVANGASELLLEIFGEAGKHARAAVGVNVLPLDSAVEVEFLFHATPPRL